SRKQTASACERIIAAHGRQRLSRFWNIQVFRYLLPYTGPRSLDILHRFIHTSVVVVNDASRRPDHSLRAQTVRQTKPWSPIIDVMLDLTAGVYNHVFRQTAIAWHTGRLTALAAGRRQLLEHIRAV